MELTYTKTGNYLIPNLMMDEQPEGDIGVYGRMRKRFLKEHRRGTYNGMLLKGTLTQHLIETNEVAQDMMDKLVKEMATAEGVTEALKRRDQIGWVGRMNNIRARADEIVRNDLIYV